jgi:hypothetical protein
VVDLDLDGRIQRPANEIGHPVQERADVDRARTKVLTLRKGKKPLNQGRGPACGLKAGVDQSMRFFVGLQPAAKEVEIANHRGQKIVEVVGNPARQLPEGLQLLCLMQLDQRQLVFSSTLLDSFLQTFIGGLQPLFAFLKRHQAGSCVILAPTRSKRCPGKADQGCRMERSFQECDVAQRVQEAPRFGVALEPATLAGQKDEWQVRPFRLVANPLGNPAKIGTAQRLFGDQNKSGIVAQFADQALDIRTDERRNSRFAEDARGDRRVAADGREDEGGL